jgi:hypothetical protein
MSPPDGTAGLHRLGMRELPPRLRPLTAAEFLALDLPLRGLILDPWPPFRRWGRKPLYRWGDTLDWARSRLGPPMRSTSEADAA